jgi:maltose alpha-D-glucosyltransferase / alpha-amylase
MNTPTLTVNDWTDIFLAPAKLDLEKQILPDYLKSQRWFASKAKKIQSVHLLPPLAPSREFAISVAEVRYASGEIERYLLPLFIEMKLSDAKPGTLPADTLCIVTIQQKEFLLRDAIHSDAFREFLFTEARTAHRTSGQALSLSSHRGDAFAKLGTKKRFVSKALTVEQSNSALLYRSETGVAFFTKLFRKLEAGENPDAEVLEFLSETASFTHAPRFGAKVELTEHAAEKSRSKNKPMLAALFQTFTENNGTAWAFSLDELNAFYRRVEWRRAPEWKIPDGFFGHTEKFPSDLKVYFGNFLPKATLLGKRTAELHLALAAGKTDAFKPEPLTENAKKALEKNVQRDADAMLTLLDSSLARLNPLARVEAQQILSKRDAIKSRLSEALQKPIPVNVIRIHGDYHLGQTLYAKNNFVIIDFEGEPMRSLEERREKKPAFQDVAGMIRSFHYAAYAAMLQNDTYTQETLQRVAAWAEVWHYAVSEAFLRGYLKTAKGASFLPAKADDQDRLLNIFLMSKALYELGYELNHRPDWVMIPLRGVAKILGETK